MEAITKNKQSEETLALMIHKAFSNKMGIGYTIREMEGGFCNVVYLIEFKDGEEYVLKIAPSDEIEMMTYEEGLLETEVSVLRLMEEKTTIPAPRVVYADDTCTICNAPYFLMTKVEGDSYVDVRKDFTEEEHLQIKRQLGQMNKEMNEIVGNQFGIYSIPSTFSNSCNEFMLKLFRMMLDDGIKAGSDLKYITYENLWQLIEEKSISFFEVKEPRLIHWDLWDGNIFVKDKQISGIIDFERALWGDIMMEHEFSCFDNPSIGFEESYGKSEYTHSELIRRSLYRLYRMLAMIIECDYRKYSDNSQYNWVIERFNEEIKILKEL